jgi:hypothetical protein
VRSDFDHAPPADHPLLQKVPKSSKKFRQGFQEVPKNSTFLQFSSKKFQLETRSYQMLTAEIRGGWSQKLVMRCGAAQRQ